MAGDRQQQLVRRQAAAVVHHADQLHASLRDNRDQAEGLFGQLVEERLTSVQTAMDDYGDVMRRLRPCLVATPTLVPHLLPAHRTVDLVILDAVQHLPVEAVLSALATSGLDARTKLNDLSAATSLPTGHVGRHLRTLERDRLARYEAGAWLPTQRGLRHAADFAGDLLPAAA